MNGNPDSSRQFWSWFRIPILLAVFLGLLASRRWDQLVRPQVWDEEGQLISGCIHHGWGDLLVPVNGYLLFVPKVIVHISLAVSVYQYPLVGTALTWLFTVFVGLAIALSPTHLKGRVFCSMAPFLVPTNPEVFGLTLYSFWWASILLLLLPLWDEARPCFTLRLGLLLAGGMSSPVIVAILPLLYVRAFRYRNSRAEKGLALAGTAVAAVQLHFVATEAVNQKAPAGAFLAHVIPKFCGWFVAGNYSEKPVLLWALGAMVVGMVGTWLLKERRNPAAWMLVALWAAAIALSVARINPTSLNPRVAGPRYFFLPFILTFWMLAQLRCTAADGWARRATAGVAACAILNAIPVWSRGHDDLHWCDHVRSSRLFPRYSIPIQFGRSRLETWSIDEPKAAWTSLFKGEFIHFPGESEKLPTFPYTVLDGRDNAGREESVTEVGGDRRKDLAHGIVLGEGRTAVLCTAHNSGRRQLIFSLRRGDRLRFRSSSKNEDRSLRVIGLESEFIGGLPATGDWKWLDFSNSRLPDRFQVAIEDAGLGPDLWSEISVGRTGDVCIGRNQDGSLEIGVPFRVVPVCVAEWQAHRVAAGTSVVFNAPNSADSSLRWTRDGKGIADGPSGGTSVSGSDGPQLFLSHLDPSVAGTYAVITTDALGATSTDVGKLTVIQDAPKVGIFSYSMRGFVGAGGLSLCFHIVGDCPRTVLIQAVGPDLAESLHGESLSKCRLEIGDSTRILFRNTGWKSGGSGRLLKAALGGTGLADGDSAMLLTLAPGTYSATVLGVDGATGIASLAVAQIP